ncbi:DUF2116 family Zn-ribbon domain-containing protein [uncultured Methanobrevibacter sp.]|uniref:DUF2116 family Zn-ribbon domain-containing protein n=1 Tax=uncultured Methanobrevibacter sp. TaxID=253161 RepID=UPI0025E7F3AE|nr:DUF2116 family Zn-ribbon domain-containing protein [uncultured Methanobrevibacter sp.]
MSVEQHKHCPVCGTPIPMSEKTCSPDCELVITQQQKQIKRNQKIMYLLVAVFIIVWVFFMLKK